MVQGGLLGERDAEGGATQAPTATTTSTSASAPALTIQTGGGEVVLDAEALQFYLLLTQTLLLVYVTWKEATA